MSPNHPEYRLQLQEIAELTQALADGGRDRSNYLLAQRLLAKTQELAAWTEDDRPGPGHPWSLYTADRQVIDTFADQQRAEAELAEDYFPEGTYAAPAPYRTKKG